MFAFALIFILFRVCTYIFYRAGEFRSLAYSARAKGRVYNHSVFVLMSLVGRYSKEVPPEGECEQDDTSTLSLGGYRDVGPGTG